MGPRRGGIVLLLLVAACGGGTATTTTVAPVTTTTGATTTTAAGFEVTSDDGRVTVSVPHSVLTADPGLTIRPVTRDEFPAGLGDLVDESTTTVYELGPEGTVFSGAVTVSVRFDLAGMEDLAADEIPAFVLFTVGPDGFEMYDDLTVTRRGASVEVSGTTTHFSPVVAVRESATAVVTIDRERIETLPSARSVEGLLELMTEAPGVIPVTTGFRDPAGSPLPGSPTFLGVDGLPGSARGSGWDIRCEDIEEVAVLGMSTSAVFGSDAIGGVVNFITTRELFPDSLSREIRFDLDARARCLDPATSVLGIDLSGVRLATDHPGGVDWIHDREFQGGNSAGYLTAPFSPRLSTLYVGLICDNDRNGVVDPGDTMFPAYPLMGQEVQLWAVLPLFDYADYFVYLVDGAQYSGMPPGAGAPRAVSAGLDLYRGLHDGPGRFEASLGIVGSGNPFVYTVDAAEPEHSLDGNRIDYLELFRVQTRF